MAMTVEQPDAMETSGGKYVSKPGVFHAAIVGVDENPASRKGEALDGVQFTASILAGTDPSQKDKTIDIIMWNPQAEDDEKKQQQAKKVQTAFCIATCLIGHFQAGVKVTVEPTDAIGRQVVLKLRYKQKFDVPSGQWVDTDRVELSFSDIYHVDDAWVTNNSVPLESEAIKLIPANLRKAEGKPTAVAVAAQASSVDVSDI